MTARGDRFPGFDPMATSRLWDPMTAAVVTARLRPAASPTFFSDDEYATATALFGRLLAVDAEDPVPVAALVDARLQSGETDGWHYDTLPQDAQTWRITLRQLDIDADRECDASFADLPGRDQDTLIERVRDLGDDGAPWHQTAASAVWSLWTRYACTAYYSHPRAWREIGFPGPAYPRGYLNLGIDAREGFEVADVADTDPAAAVADLERDRRRRASEGA